MEDFRLDRLWDMNRKIEFILGKLIEEVGYNLEEFKFIGFKV